MAQRDRQGVRRVGRGWIGEAQQALHGAADLELLRDAAVLQAVDPPTGPNRRCSAASKATAAAAAVGSRPPPRAIQDDAMDDPGVERSSISPDAAPGASARMGAGSGGPRPSPPTLARSSSQ